jgi:hypothetical protein
MMFYQRLPLGSIFESKDGVLCAKEIHRLGPMDLKIYTLAKKPTRQLTKLSLGLLQTG